MTIPSKIKGIDMDENKQNQQTISNNQKQDDVAAKKAAMELAKKKRALRETAAFKQKYFDYYDDVKISVHEDW